MNVNSIENHIMHMMRLCSNNDRLLMLHNQCRWIDSENHGRHKHHVQQQHKQHRQPPQLGKWPTVWNWMASVGQQQIVAVAAVGVVVVVAAVGVVVVVGA
jgi:hypothetical protein